MDKIGKLIHRRGTTDQTELAASLVLEAVNQALQQVTGFAPADAHAIFYQHQGAMIAVSHGGVAGLLRQSEKEIISRANDKLAALGSTAKVIRLATRLTG